METKEQTFRNTHHGHAVKRIRHTLGIKQEVLADMMGTTQARVSNYEQKPVIEDDMIGKFSKALNVAPEFIKELEEDPVTVIIKSNTFDKKNNNVGHIANNTITNNPIEQILELNKEKTILYERILELEREKNVLLEKILQEKK